MKGYDRESFTSEYQYTFIDLNSLLLSAVGWIVSDVEWNAGAVEWT
ncbi:hypothetical protein SAMN04487967_0182 [Natronorubrum sediminis]|uniref:Uncharacterized protein n=1 Tax=Natronorubrum sediminis TaxID=640943 RepID=A0A1H6FMT0_9EURY|nr:hypothetical protein SAMN04487967_0182 [Natronorubrum sediminis]